MKDSACILTCLILILVNNVDYIDCCPEYAPPKNGQMICDHLLGKYCTPSCNDGYEPASLPAWAYVCNPTTKRWMTYPEFYPLPWPDCVLKTQIHAKAVGKSHLPRNITFARTKIYNPFGQGKTSEVRKSDSATKREKPARNGNKPNILNVDQQNKTTPSNADLKYWNSTLFENSSRVLSYQVIEHRENNRTMTNKMDLTNVTYSRNDNQNIVDIGNVSITATRDEVPSLHEKGEGENINVEKEERALKMETEKKSKDIKRKSQSREKSDPIPFHKGLTSTTKKKISPRKSVKLDNGGHIKQAKKNHFEIVTRTTLIINSDDQKQISIVPAVKDTITGVDITPSTSQTKNETEEVHVNNETSGMDAPGEFAQQRNMSKVTNFTAPLILSAHLSNTILSDRSSVKSNNTGTSARSNFISVNGTTVPQLYNKTIVKALKNNNTITRNKTKSHFSDENNVTNSIGHSNTTLFGNKSLTSSNRSLSSIDESENDHTTRKNITSKYNSTVKDRQATKLNISENLTLKQQEEANLLTSPENDKSIHGPGKNDTLTKLVSKLHERSDRGTNPKNDIEKRILKKDSKEETDKVYNKHNDADKSDLVSSKNKVSGIQNCTLHEHGQRNTSDVNQYNGTTLKRQHESSLINITNSTSERHGFLLNDQENGTKRSDNDISLDVSRKSLLPVFTKRDLNLLRHMVSGSMPNSKRSELRHASTSLWSKMLSLTTNLDSRSLKKPRLPARKELAHRDSPIAHLIMSKVNKNSDYKFQDKINPFLYGLKKGSHSKAVESNPSTRQYVWNGATYIPAADLSSGAFSYLNSDTGGGLSEKSNYIWNGATFVPRENTDSNSVTSSSDSNKIRQIFPDDITNKEIQGILKMWNGHASKVPDLLPDSSSTQNIVEKTDSSSTSPTTTMSTTNFVTGISSNEQIRVTGQTYAPLAPTTKRPEKLYYWDGEKYNPLVSASNLAEGTIKYKFDGQNYNPIGEIPYDQYANLATDTNKPANPYATNTGLSNSETVNDFSTTVTPTESTTTPYSSYDWTGAVLLPENKNTQYIADQTANDVSSKTDTREGIESEGTPTRENNVENILQSHYPPSPPPFTPAPKNSIDQFPSGESPKPTSSPMDQIKSPDVFQAIVNYPTKGNGQSVNDVSKSSEQTSQEKNILSTTTTDAQKDSFKSPTSKTSIAFTPTQPISPISKTGTHMVLMPPPNPYAAPPDSSNLQSFNQNHEPSKDKEVFIDPKLSHEDRIKTYMENLPKLNYMKELPKVNPNSINPFREDAENLETVIETDLNLKREIESLSQLYQNSPANTLVSVPVALTQSPNNLHNRLLVSRLIPPKPNLEEELINDLHHKAPEDTAAEKDIEAADQSLQREEDKQNYALSIAAVKTNVNDKERTEKLKAILQKAKDEEEYQNDLMSIRDGNKNGTYIDSLSMKEKNDIETTLNKDMAKLQSDSVAHEPVSPAIMASSVQNRNENTEQKTPNDIGEKFVLSVSDIRELLKLTKLAERESAAKKHGLTYPTIANADAMHLLRKPGIQNFLTYLKKNHSLIREKIGTNKLEELKKKKEVYKKALAKLLSSWDKRYRDIKSASGNPLPKFMG